MHSTHPILEIVSPVVIGAVRPRQTKKNEGRNQVISHYRSWGFSGSGQGVVQETLNMSNARGYTVGGTIRIVINNQIGFTISTQMTPVQQNTVQTSG